MKYPLSLTAAMLFTCSMGFGQSPGERMFKQWDKNGDGMLEPKEVPVGPRKIFARKDTNGDGKVSLAEHLGHGGGGKGNNGKGPQRESKGATFSIKQTWAQESQGFERPVYVAEPAAKNGKVPVILFFHGGGGNAESQINSWARNFSDHLVVAPQGYQNGWNVHGEKSKAPDVEFFKQVIAEIGRRYRYADMENVSLIGSSNGAAYIYRILIEVEEDLFRNAVPMVSSLLEVQYQKDTFWKPSSDTDDYDTEVPTITKRRILYVHGTKDTTVPYEGGVRFGKFQHISAPETAWILARAQGYPAGLKRDKESIEISKNIIQCKYEGTEVTFIAVEGGNHGLQPHRDASIEVVRDFLEH